MTEFSIYQINMDRDAANVCFIGMESLEKIKGTKEVNAAAYDRVYDGKMDCIRLLTRLLKSAFGRSRMSLICVCLIC